MNKKPVFVRPIGHNQTFKHSNTHTREVKGESTKGQKNKE